MRRRLAGGRGGVVGMTGQDCERSVDGKRIFVRIKVRRG